METNTENNTETNIGIKLNTNDLNKYCRNCGCKLEENAKFCPNCGEEVITTRVVIEKQLKEKEEMTQKEKKSLITVLSLLGIGVLFNFILSFFLLNVNFEINEIIENILLFVAEICYLVGIIYLIYVRVTLKDSKRIKILFDIILTLIIIYISYIIISRYMFIRSCEEMG